MADATWRKVVASVVKEDRAVNPKELNSVDGWWGKIQRLILPAHCLLCAQDGDDARDLCAACAGDLPRNPLNCPRCALPLYTPALPGMRRAPRHHVIIPVR